MEALGAVTLVVGLLALVVAVVVVSSRAAKKRAEALSVAAGDMKFTFSADADQGLLDRLKHFHLFSQGRSKKITNVLRGQAGDLEVAVFDYAYTTGGGQHSRRWKQTVILFESAKMHLPRFALRPENVFHRIGQVFGYGDIDFDSHPEFSKRYLLRGENEDEVRAAFSVEVLSFYEDDLKLSTEAAGGQLIHYRGSKKVPPEQISDFIKQGVRVLTLFRRWPG